MRACALLLILAALPSCEEQAEALPGAPPEVIKRCAELSRRIEAMLGPKFKQPVPVYVVDDAFIARYAREAVDRMIPTETQKLLERIAVRLCHIPADCDLVETEIQLFRKFEKLCR